VYNHPIFIQEKCALKIFFREEKKIKDDSAKKIEKILGKKFLRKGPKEEKRPPKKIYQHFENIFQKREDFSKNRKKFQIYGFSFFTQLSTFSVFKEYFFEFIMNKKMWRAKISEHEF
jgi:hypothetical protein